VAAMIGLILIKAGLNPTVILGTKLKEFGDSNFRMGGKPKSKIKNQKSKILVIEADEYKESFLNYWPKIIVLTTLEPDHLDYFRNFKNYLLAFKKFISHLPPPPKHRCGGLPKNGTLIINKNTKNVNTTFFAIAKNIVYYSLKQKETKKIKKFLKVPGEFNVSNALAALMTARALKIPDKISFKALSEYKGTWRRFELIEADLRGFRRGSRRKITIISDYAHHPTQIRETLKAAREKFPKKKIWCVFQPHQYQRTYYLFDDFVKVFQKALQQTEVGSLLDKIIITDIYEVAGREEKEIKKKISSVKLIKAIKKPWAIYLPKEKVIKHLRKNLKGGEVVIVMGAGDIYKLCEQLTKSK
jgi:UDP-N-acetylmuramate--alanine ligase